MKCCGQELQWKDYGEPWDDYSVEVTHCSVCKTFYERKKDKPQVIYVQRLEDRNYRCKNCNSIIKSVGIFHTVHDPLILLAAGSGKIKYERVPFCPNCEEKPSSHGSPRSGVQVY